MSVTGLTDGQLSAITITERVNSAISVAAIIFILATYMFSSHFDKPINRLIFFASWGNLGSNVAAFISHAGPAAGSNSHLCQFQAFLVQMFLGVDALWAFCMALNVYLAFFRGYSIIQLRHRDPKYLVFCYGVSFVPALVFLFVQTHDRGKVYGPAIIWCWVDVQWDFMRIVFLYVWIWVGIVFALAVYIAAGMVIYKKRRLLEGFLNPLNEHPFSATITTEVEVISEPSTDVMKRDTEAQTCQTQTFNPYAAQVHIDSGTCADKSRDKATPALLRMRSFSREVAEDAVHPEAWLYARVAFLFYIALLITWIPPSVNRVYAVRYPDVINFAMNYAASFVFPLQGFWNMLVYIITSQTACRRLWVDMGGLAWNRQSGPRDLRPPQQGRFAQRLRLSSSNPESRDSDDTIQLTAKRTNSMKS